MERRWSGLDYLLLRKYTQPWTAITWNTPLNSIPNALYALTKEDALLLSPEAATKLVVQNNRLFDQCMYVYFDPQEHIRVHCLLTTQFQTNTN